jgi:hypothetical protein
MARIRARCRRHSGRRHCDHFRIVLRRLDRKPGLAGAVCLRNWWPNDIVHESVVLGTSSDGRELTAASVPRVRTGPQAGSIAWRWPSPSPFLERLRDLLHFCPPAAIDPPPVPIDRYDLKNDRLFVDRQ